MRSYTSLDIMVKNARIARKVEKILPERYKRAGGANVPINPSYGYEFDPALIKKEIIGLVGKLIDLDVKWFFFKDTRSLGEDD